VKLLPLDSRRAPFRNGQGPQNRFQLRSVGAVGIGLDRTRDTWAIDHKARGYRQMPRRITTSERAQAAINLGIAFCLFSNADANGPQRLAGDERPAELGKRNE